MPSASSESRPDSEQMRQRILDVCQRLFASRGYDGTGIEHIARQAHIAKSLIYYYFKNKEGVLQAILERFVQRTIQHRSQQRSGLQAALEIVEANQEVVRIILMESLKDPGSAHVLGCLKQVLAAGLEGEELDLNRTFLGFMPLACFTLFRDRWCEMTGADPERARAQLIASYSAPYPQLLKDTASSRGE